ncbi:hypothetical protein M0R72_01775 [Candidatus Pacearchaeota archaeon]|jgi:hypothetical protein|nr:hypothetical protein [Candidatus Pacearchaeota archaeon]
MNDDKDAVERILEAKTRQPEHQRLDMEPKVGGNSLLHDEFGMPKVSGGHRRNVPEIKEISGEPVVVKASKPSSKISFKKPNQPTQPKVEDDDHFIPPKSNFVAVGHVEHSWYDDKVAGPSVVDNNEEVDIEKLQGLNPLVDIDNAKIAKSVEFFRKKLTYVKNFTVTELAEVNDEQDLSDLKVKIFGNKGIFTDILKKLGSLKAADRPVIGELVNLVYSELQLEIEGKAYELESEAAEANEVTEWPEDMAVITRDEEPDEEDEDEIPDEETEENEADDEESSNSSSDSQTVPEGHYAIIVDGKLLNIVESANKASDVISHLLLSENLTLDSIQLIKRIKIDFGIILGE